MWVPQVPRSADPQFSNTQEYGKILTDFGNQPSRFKLCGSFIQAVRIDTRLIWLKKQPSSVLNCFELKRNTIFSG